MKQITLSPVAIEENLNKYYVLFMSLLERLNLEIQETEVENSSFINVGYKLTILDRYLFLYL